MQVRAKRYIMHGDAHYIEGYRHAVAAGLQIRLLTQATGLLSCKLGCCESRRRGDRN
jgi:hypothetical protein